MRKLCGAGGRADGSVGVNYQFLKHNKHITGRGWGRGDRDYPFSSIKLRKGEL